jgi:hypothetical protein
VIVEMPKLAVCPICSKEIPDLMVYYSINDKLGCHSCVQILNAKFLMGVKRGSLQKHKSNWGWLRE